MNGGKIHFRNKPFMALVVVGGTDAGLVKCTPVVYDDPSNCGVGLLYEGGEGLVWGLVSPRDLITSWRATEVLRRLDTINNKTLCEAYYTGLRDPSEYDMKSYVEPTIAKIGRAAYKAIMAMPVPEQIVRTILDNQKSGYTQALWPITNEVRAGTIQWRQEFADVGIEHPSEVDAKKRAQKKTIAKFERLLVSYAIFRNLPRQGMGMDGIKSALLTLVDKGADKTHSDRLLVALAGIAGELGVFEFAMAISSFGAGSHEESELRMYDERKESAIDHSAAWLVSNSGPSRLAFWKRQPNSFTPDSAKEMLRRLLGEYFPTKSETVPA